MAATLGVDTIQHTNGTTAVTVGTNGSVTAAGTLGVTGLTSLTTMNTTGNVGIGTSSPQSELHLSTASSPEIRLTDTTNSVEANFYTNDSLGSVGSKSNHPFIIGTNNTERMRINSSGNVGIGTTSPAHNLEIVSTASGSVNDTLQIRNNATASGTGSRIRFINSTDATSDTNGASIASIRTGNDNDLTFETENVERMRIDSAGRLLIGGTSTDPISIAASSIAINQNGYFNINRASGIVAYMGRSGSNGNLIVFYKNTSFVGGISITGSSTSFNTSSDYRLKENVDYDWDATTRLKQLKPARFNFIADDTNTLVDGFIAHEVSSIVPEAINGTKDEVDDNGDAVMQGIDQSKLVPLLIKTIQELEARITALEA